MVDNQSPILYNNDMDIQIGNICKFEDFEPFEGRKACYKIGKVTRVENGLIDYDVLLDVWRGEVWNGNNPETMQAPLPGNLFRDWPTRVQVLS